MFLHLHTKCSTYHYCASARRWQSFLKRKGIQFNIARHWFWFCFRGRQELYNYYHCESPYSDSITIVMRKWLSYLHPETDLVSSLTWLHSDVWIHSYFSWFSFSTAFIGVSPTNHTGRMTMQHPKMSDVDVRYFQGMILDDFHWLIDVLLASNQVEVSANMENLHAVLALSNDAKIRIRIVRIIIMALHCTNVTVDFDVCSSSYAMVML